MPTSRIAALQKAARETERRIFASQPFMLRFAHAMTVLAAIDTAAWGKTLVMTMIKAGVTGLDDIDGQPAAEWAKHRRFDPAKLPKNYMHADKLGAELYHEALLLLGSPAAAAEFMQDLTIGFLSGSFKFKDTFDFRSAKSYIFTIVRSRGKNRIRDDKDRRNKSLSPSDDEDDDRGEGAQYGLQSDRDFVDHAEIIQKVLRFPDVKRGLAAIHADAELFVDLLMDGYSQREIIMNKMLPNWGDKSVQAWDKTYKPKINKLLAEMFKKHLPDKVLEKLHAE